MIRASLCALVTMGWVCGLSHGADWPDYRGLERDGVSSEKIHWGKDGPEIAWKAEVGIGVSSMSIKDGKLYTMGHTDGKNAVHCLDALTGKSLWTFEYEAELDPNMFEGGPSATPVLADGFVITVGRHGQVHCLKADSGEVVWSKNYEKDYGGRRPMWGYSGSPLVADGKVILEPGSPSGSVVAVDLKTGKTLWVSGKNTPGYSSPVLLDDKTVLVFDGAGLSAYALANGRLSWFFPWKTEYEVNASNPLVVGPGKILISSAYGRGGALVKVSGNKPKVVWEHAHFDSHFSGFIVEKNVIYSFCGNDGGTKLRALDLKSGEIKWEKGGFAMGSLIKADDRLLALTRGGELILIRPSGVKYDEEGRIQVLGKRTWASPALSNGLLYCRNNEGQLVCLKVK